VGEEAAMSVQGQGPAGARHTARKGDAARHDVVLIVLLLAMVTALHLFTTSAPEMMSVHLLYRKLYYVPIIYAGFVFGWRRCCSVHMPKRPWAGSWGPMWTTCTRW
jgi:hypothetical protein